MGYNGHLWARLSGILPPWDSCPLPCLPSSVHRSPLSTAEVSCPPAPAQCSTRAGPVPLSVPFLPAVPVLSATMSANAKARTASPRIAHPEVNQKHFLTEDGLSVTCSDFNTTATVRVAPHSRPELFPRSSHSLAGSFHTVFGYIGIHPSQKTRSLPWAS